MFHKAKVDKLYTRSAQLCLSLGVLFLLFIFAFLFKQAAPALKEVGLLAFFVDASWAPLSQDQPQFGIAPMIVGTFLIACLSALLALPLAWGTAIILRFGLPKKIAHGIRSLMHTLASLPSVVYGFVGLVFWVPWVSDLFGGAGHGALAASLVLACMLYPSISLALESVFKTLPPEFEANTKALGLSKYTTVKLSWAYVKPMVVSTSIMQWARAIGETMAVLMVCGNIPDFPDGVLSGVRTMTTHMALEMAYAAGTHRSALYVTGLILFLICLGLSLLSFLQMRQSRLS